MRQREKIGKSEYFQKSVDTKISLLRISNTRRPLNKMQFNYFFCELNEYVNFHFQGLKLDRRPFRLLKWDKNEFADFFPLVNLSCILFNFYVNS